MWPLRLWQVLALVLAILIAGTGAPDRRTDPGLPSLSDAAERLEVHETDSADDAPWLTAVDASRSGSLPGASLARMRETPSTSATGTLRVRATGPPIFV